MIIKVVLAFLIAVVSWLSVMYIWWKKEEGVDEVALSIHGAYRPLGKATRLIRRTWYTTLYHYKGVTVWVNQKVSAIFLSLFPKAAPAFAKRDVLTGLKQGPSSYFLLSISEQKVKQSRRRAY